jgi:hypothetical protein
MDENPKSPIRLHAPGASSGSYALRLPGARSWPAVDDHLVVPEVTREEVVRGVRMQAMPADPPHADLHRRLDGVVGACALPDYEVSSDLLTRWSEGSNFASDTSIRKGGIDPATGHRYLEEVVFEVVSTQSQADIRRRAEDMAARGVRRIFAIFVKKGEVCEWSAKLRAFQPLAANAVIRDKTLVYPLPVKSLLDDAAADEAMIEGADARKVPRLEAIKAESEAKGRAEGEVKGRAEGEVKGRAEGKAEGLVEAILILLENRGIKISPAQRAQLLACRDLEVLSLWLRRAPTAAAEELFA